MPGKAASKLASKASEKADLLTAANAAASDNTPFAARMYAFERLDSAMVTDDTTKPAYLVVTVDWYEAFAVVI